MTNSKPPAWLAGALAAAKNQDSLTGQRLPCISLYFPWLHWVFMGWKPIETRTHQRFKSLVGKRILLHAAMKADRDFGRALPYLGQEQINDTWDMDFSPLRGHILGSAVVTNHRRLTPADAPSALIECETPRWGLFLTCVMPFTTPIPAKGYQGVWYHQF